MLVKVKSPYTSLITTYGGDTRYQYYYYSEHEKAPNSATYAKDNLPTFYQLYYNSRYAVYDYDNINRLNQRMFSLDTPLYYNYIYKLSDRNASGENLYRTHQVEEEYIGNDVYIYGYDVLGNITSIKKAERKSTDPASSNFKEFKNSTDYVSYQYDGLNQLTQELDYSDAEVNKYTDFIYDELGNITQKWSYTRNKEVFRDAHDTKIVQYNYGADPDSDEDGKAEAGWNNLLTSVTTTEFDENGEALPDVTETIDYDEIGNPTTYLGATLQWNGRQLTSYVEGDKVTTYTYDANGLRASKTVAKIGKKTISGIEMPYIIEQTDTKYYYVNGQLHFQDSLTTKSDGSTVVTKLYFYYDSYGYLSCIKYNGSNYYVATNQRGDVVALYYPGGKIMGRYEYDAWGNVTKITDIYYDAAGNQVTADLTNNTTSRDLLVINPIRYRGYYYDTETELYYLQSRYYNAEVGRFLNADVQLNDDILGNNTFAYCSNNPVSRKDDTGTVWWVAASAVIGGVVGGVSRVASNLLTGKKWYEGVIGSTIAGVVAGAIATTGHLATASYVSVALESTINEAISYTKVSWLSGSKQKTFTNNNLSNSCATVIKDTAIKGFFAYVTGNVFGGSNATFDISPTTSVAWGSVDVIVSALESVQVGLATVGQDYTVEFMSQKFGQIPQMQLFPETYVDEWEEQ